MDVILLREMTKLCNNIRRIFPIRLVCRHRQGADVLDIPVLTLVVGVVSSH